MQMNFTSFSLLTSTPCHSVLYPNALMIQKNIKQLLLDNTKDNSLKTGYINNISLLSETKCQSTFYLGNLKVMVKFRTHLRMTDNYPKSAHSAKIIQTNISKVEHDLGNLFTRLMIYVVAFLCLEKNYNTKIKSHFVELISLSHFRCQEKSSGPPQSF